MRKLTIFAALMALAGFMTLNHIDAQRGGRGGKGGPKVGKGPGPKGGGGNAEDWKKRADEWRKKGGKLNLPPLKVEDAKSDGGYDVVNLLPGDSESRRIGLTKDMAYRPFAYDNDTKVLTFAKVEFTTGTLGTFKVTLPKDAPDYNEVPEIGFDSGEWCVIGHQASVVFVDVNKGKAKLASEIDSKQPMDWVKAPKKKDRKKKKAAKESGGYRVHAGTNGATALVVYQKFHLENNAYTTSGATLYSAEGSDKKLEWDHNEYGVPPRGRDAVFSVTDDEIAVLTTKPKKAGDFSSACELFVLTFDPKSGSFKGAEKAKGDFAGNNASQFSLSPSGKFVVAHPEDSMKRFVFRRADWERTYQCDYYDPLLGFAPDMEIGVFLENHSPERAAIVAIELDTGKKIWNTTAKHSEVTGDGEMEPFSGVGPGAASLSANFGIIAGVSSSEPEFLFTENVAEFEPLCMSYDEKGKMVAVLALDRVFVLDAKTTEELHSIRFESPLPAGTLGEFIRFSEKGDKILCCARGQGIWLMDVKSATIEKTLKAPDGQWALPLTDLSGVIYSQSSDNGGNTMLQKLDADAPTVLHQNTTEGAQAICFWAHEDNDQFLIIERANDTVKTLLVDDEDKVEVEYDIEGQDPMFVGADTVTAFVTRKQEAVLINEINRMGYTGVNCVVLSSSKGMTENFSAVFKSEELPGASTYGKTAAGPFFASVFAGNEKKCDFACPAGVLEIEVSKNTFTLHAWSRAPKGLAAVSPKGKNYFVAGAKGLTTYKYK